MRKRTLDAQLYLSCSFVSKLSKRLTRKPSYVVHVFVRVVGGGLDALVTAK